MEGEILDRQTFGERSAIGAVDGPQSALQMPAGSAFAGQMTSWSVMR